MRRSAMPSRKTPLEQKTALNRTTALKSSPLSRSAVHAQSAANQRQPRSKRRTLPTIPTRVRIALAVRSGGRCEIATTGCTGIATEAVHRIKVGMGGRKGASRAAHDVLSNLLHACHGCHQTRGHRAPTAAYVAGWMLREHQNPLSEPVLYRGTWCLLEDDGSIRYPLTYAKEAS